MNDSALSSNQIEKALIEFRDDHPHYLEEELSCFEDALKAGFELGHQERPDNDWVEFPNEGDLYEVFIPEGLGYTEFARYVSGKWYGYLDEEMKTPLAIERWRVVRETA